MKSRLSKIVTTALLTAIVVIGASAAIGPMAPANAGPEIARPATDGVGETQSLQAATLVTPGSALEAKMGAAERLQIKFQGYAELTGEYRVGPDGTITIPVIGRINVGNLGPAELEATLGEQVVRMTGKEAFVTVEVTEYRSVFVSGYVAKPGAFPWRPGMSVLQAVALAGGAFNNDIGVGDDKELERLRKAIAGQARNLAIMARLDAELNDSSTIEMPTELPELVDNATARNLIEAQTSELVSRNAALEMKRASLAKALETARKELDGLKQQRQRLEAQLDMRLKLKHDIDDLRSKGHISNTRAIEEFSKVSELEDRGTNISVGMARVQAVIAQLEHDEANLVHERRADIDTDKFKLGRDVVQLEIEIESARATYKRLTGKEAPTTLDPLRERSVKYEIVRQTASGPLSLRSDQLTPLSPGDILMISLE